MVDFVEEVEEQLRAERYANLANRYLPWVVIALVATIVGWLGVWGYNSWNDKNVAASSIAYDKAVATAASGDLTGAANAFAVIGKTGPSGYRTLALMQEGNLRLLAGKAEEAAGYYDQAAKAAPNAILKDLASLRAAQAVMDAAPYVQVESRLKALIGDNRPYTLEAREMLAMAKLQAGRVQEARGDFNALSLTLGVSPGMRTRAQGAIGLIDSGQAGVVGDVVKAAATMPPLVGPTVPGLAGAQEPVGEAQAPDQGAGASKSDQNPSGNPQ